MMRAFVWMIVRPALLLATFVSTASAVSDEAGGPAAVPDAAALQSAETLVRDIFRGEYDAAKDDRAKVALAKKILAMAVESTDSLAEQFVLFRVARDIAAAAGDVDTALNAVNELGRRFRVDALKMKVDVLERAATKARLPADHRALLPQFARVSGEATAAERFELARQLGRFATASAARSRDVAARKKIADQLEKLEQLEEAFAAVKHAVAVLEEQPTDPDANLTVGKYRCFAKGDWERGLPMLALSRDPQLKTLAQQELAGPDAAEDQKNLADGWWALAEHMTGDDQQQARRRGGHWYRQALAGLSGLEKVRATKRIEQLGEETGLTASKPPGPGAGPRSASRQPVNLLRMIDLRRDTIKGIWRFDRGALVSSGGTLDRIHLPFVPPEEYSLEIVATRVSGTKGFTIGLVGGGKTFTVDLDCMGQKSGISCVDGKSSFLGNASVRSGKVLFSGKPAKILCQVHKGGVRASVNGRVVVDWQNGFDRISADKGWSPKDPRLPLIGSSMPFYIHSITLTPVSAPGQPAHPAN
jgi:hypothetical protein